MDMQHACATMLEDIDGALGSIVIDMQTGLTVAAEYRPGSVVDAGAINLVSVISTDMFRGRMIREFESVLARRRGQLAGFVREVQMTTAVTNQFMAAIPGWDDGVFVLVTDKSVSLGLGWMAVHRLIGRMASEGAALMAPSAAQPAQRPPARPDPRVAAGGAAPARAEPGVGLSAPPPSIPVAAVAQPAVPEPYGGPVQRPAGHALQGHAAVAVPQTTSPALGKTDHRQQGGPPATPEEPPPVLGPRANFLTRKRRGARK